MNLALQQKPQDARVDQIVKLAIMAVGGQGGGVLTGWIEALARGQGYACQATSVAGVSQRTGATIYYIEMTPASDRQPIFALAPAGGDVDVLIAAEMMEVGRAIQRGFVTPDRTVLIGSTHRALAVSEKTVPGDGVASSDEVRAAAELAAMRLILADMDRLAVSRGSVISASLFGALAGSGALPFAREAYEDAIRAGGKGVDASLRAFAAGFDAAQHGKDPPVATPGPPDRDLVGPASRMAAFQALTDRIKLLPAPVREIARSGLMKVVDFQDCAYGTTYLDRLTDIVGRDTADQGWALSLAAAKHIANAMAYDDIIRVADLKTRRPRFDHIRDQMHAQDDNLVELTEFFHPRADEIVSLLPAAMGARWESSPRRMALLNRLFSKGRRIRTHRLRSFLLLYGLGGLTRYRLKTRRHAVEVAHLETWLGDCMAALDSDYALAVELLNNRRLIKGYSDTHARGMGKFATVMGAASLLHGRADAADWMRRLRDAALEDPDGNALEGALKTVRSFV